MRLLQRCESVRRLDRHPGKFEPPPLPPPTSAGRGAQLTAWLAFLLSMLTQTPQQDALCCCLVQLASPWWSSRVKALQRESGLAKKQVNGMAVLEAVPHAPAYWWPADPAFRKIGSGGQGSVY